MTASAIFCSRYIITFDLSLITTKEHSNLPDNRHQKTQQSSITKLRYEITVLTT